MFSTSSHIIVSTKVVNTMDLARVCSRRCLVRHHSVVRDFAITDLAPTVFYLELLYLQVMFSLSSLVLPGYIFGLILKNKMAAKAIFKIFS